VILPPTPLEGDDVAGRLVGKVAIVTGAGTGMGQAIAVALAEEGANLTLAGRTVDTLEGTAAAARERGVDVLVAPTDVSDAAQAEAMVAATVERWGRVDLLVNNAGTNRKRRSYADQQREDWDAVVRTNLDGVYHCTQAVLPILRRQGGGQVINISSQAGRRASALSGVAYSAAKHGVVALTQSLNDEEWRNGIRACCIEPGEVATPIMEFRPQVPPRETWVDMLQPEDLAEAVRYVATSPARVLVDEISIRPRVRRLG
jgi:NADP-dependent 3-hydroxy acid dehydrogenase YdfG